MTKQRIALHSQNIKRHPCKGKDLPPAIADAKKHLTNWYDLPQIITSKLANLYHSDSDESCSFNSSNLAAMVGLRRVNFLIVTS